MGTLRIRAATTLDVDAAVRMRAAAWQETYQGMYADDFLTLQARPEELERQAGIWRTAMYEQGYTYWLLVDIASGEEEIVGFALAIPARGENPPTLLELQMFYLLQKVQGTGAADALLEYAIGDADCCLWVVEANQRARRFYERHGFRWLGESGTYQDVAELRYVRRAED